MSMLLTIAANERDLPEDKLRELLELLFLEIEKEKGADAATRALDSIARKFKDEISRKEAHGV